MRYLELLQTFGNEPLISISEIRKVFPDFHNRRLHEWQEKGYVEKICNGEYIWAGKSWGESSMFFIANRLYRPSYISLWTALSWHGLIPESVMRIYSISTLKTRELETKIGSFVYRSMKPELFWGYGLKTMDGRPVLMAEPEKALLDTFYLETKLSTVEDLHSLRLNPIFLQEKVNKERLLLYSSAFNHRVQTLVNLLINQPS
jgi:predicted transcriptional regulator of viral defense system